MPVPAYPSFDSFGKEQLQNILNSFKKKKVNFKDHMLWCVASKWNVWLQHTSQGLWL